MARPALSRLIPALFALGCATADAEPMRLATFNASLTRAGPGLLLKDLMAGDDAQIAAVVGILATVRPDVVLINEFDYDADGAALALFADALRRGGLDYPHHFSAPSNTGVPSGLDLDGDGDATGPQDAFGWGRFPGQYGMALLSRWPVAADDSATFRTMLWSDLPGALLPVRRDGTPFPSADAHAVLRLSSKSHWDVAVDTPGGRLRVLAAHPTPPVFDGPQDFNGRRNHDEIRFWQIWLDGAVLPSDTGPRRHDGSPFVILGDLNADPADGDGLRQGIVGLLADPRLTDPHPVSAGGAAAAAAQGGTNTRHRGDPARDTADWRDDARGPGNLRVDYVLPSAALRVTGAGVHWPAPGQPGFALTGDGAPVSSDHRLVWVDVDWP